jgi:sulfide dehydrogenase [flavocytochrome c] flavoprotein chain
MAQVTRRQFGGLAAAGTFGVLAGGLARPSLAAGPAKIVVVGGGPAGATVANRLKTADATLDITLVEPKELYSTCFYSNIYLGGFRSFQSITHSYDGIKKRGITVVHDMAASVDTTAKTVTLAKASTPLSYDRLVIAPGIDIKYDAIEGYTKEARVDGRAADVAAETQAARHAGWWHRGDNGAAKSVSLPAGAV